MKRARVALLAPLFLPPCPCCLRKRKGVFAGAKGAGEESEGEAGKGLPCLPSPAVPRAVGESRRDDFAPTPVAPSPIRGGGRAGENVGFGRGDLTKPSAMWYNVGRWWRNITEPFCADRRLIRMATAEPNIFGIPSSKGSAVGTFGSLLS